jgi:hypothetical protein
MTIIMITVTNIGPMKQAYTEVCHEAISPSNSVVQIVKPEKKGATPYLTSSMGGRHCKPMFKDQQIMCIATGEMRRALV